MLGNNCFRKIITSSAAAAVLCAYSMVVLAVPQDVTAEISVTGQVTVNGQPAISNSTIVSGSAIVTGANSSAVISLGKTGRVEVLADSNLVLNFSASGIVGILSSGKARISNAPGVAATITTKDATVIADAGQANAFVVEVECSHTHVDTAVGVVTMREGTMDRQVSAGTSATAGNLSQTGCKPCMRPDSAPPVKVGGWWVWAAVAGVVVATLFLGSGDNDIGGDVIIVSPVRVTATQQPGIG